MEMAEREAWARTIGPTARVKWSGKRGSNVCNGTSHS
jgi:hypothetical protein